LDHLVAQRWSRPVPVGCLTRAPKVHPLSKCRAAPAHSIAEGPLLPNRAGPGPAAVRISRELGGAIAHFSMLVLRSCYDRGRRGRP
jgi:hypothetical protein